MTMSVTGTANEKLKQKLIAAFIAAGLSAPAAFVAYGIGK